MPVICMGIRMKKKTQMLLTLLWGVAVAGSRILLFLLRKQATVDTYEYFANAMIRTGKSDVSLNSGLAYAYTKNLSGVLRFTGNRIEAVSAYQMVLQIFWIIFLFIGICMVFGRLAGMISTTILAVLPVVLNSIFTVSPENFYMLHLSFVLIILGIFLIRTGKTGWYRSSLCELYLMIAGFYLGVICIWNYIGWCLAAVSIYILIRNHLALREGICEQKNDEERELREQLMGAGSQAFILFTGVIVGMYATLMKYTGLTGKTIAEQFNWWVRQLGSFPGRCQDIPGWFIFVLMGAVITGILCRMFIKVRSKKIEKISAEATEKAHVNMEQIEERQTEEQVKEAQTAVEEKQDGYVITEDGRKIKLLDNPLPGPKKHVKREIGFDYDEIDVNNNKKDFDIEIGDNDDFDF